MSLRFVGAISGLFAMATLGLTPAEGARANPLIEALIEDAEPCSALRIDDFKLVEIAVDRFKSLTIHDVAMTMNNDAVQARIDATLYCETGPNAALTGDMGGRVAIDLSADLATCRVNAVDAKVSELGGRIPVSLVEFLNRLGFKADVLGMLATRLEADLESAAREEAEGQCLKAKERTR